MALPENFSGYSEPRVLRTFVVLVAFRCSIRLAVKDRLMLSAVFPELALGWCSNLSQLTRELPCYLIRILV